MNSSRRRAAPNAIDRSESGILSMGAVMRLQRNRQLSSKRLVDRCPRPNYSRSNRFGQLVTVTDPPGLDEVSHLCEGYIGVGIYIPDSL